MRISQHAHEVSIKQTKLEIAIYDLWPENMDSEEYLQVLARSIDHILAHDLLTRRGTVAQIELQNAIEDLRQKSDLTRIEFIQSLTSLMQSRLKYDLRFERHGNYDTPAMYPTEEEARP